MNIGKENESIEFKRSTSEIKEGLISIAAILNKHHKGTLYFGVKNNGEVIGQEIGEDTLNRLSQAIANNIKPGFVYEVQTKQLDNGKAFIEVSFYGDKVPYSAFSRYYLRFHDEDRIMDNDILRDYYRRISDDYSYWENANSFAPIEDVDQELVNRYYEECKEKGRIDCKLENASDFLGKMGLLFNNQFLNNAGNVLFSKRKPLILKLATFAGENRLTILDNKIFSGNVFECIDRSLDYLKQGMNWRADFDGSIRRIDTPEVPLLALREIVVNAFSHGEYNSNTDFEIDIYKDRFSIYSPGHFPSLYTPEKFASQNIAPIPLNIKISQALYRSGAIEQMSTGFARTFASLKEADVGYRYSETPNGFRFEFLRKSARPSELSRTEKKVLDLILQNPNITTQNMADLAGTSQRTIARAIASLKIKGVIERVGSYIKGSWHVL